MNREDVIRYIQASKDKEELGEIIQIAREHIEKLDHSPGVLRLVCKNGNWFAVFPSNRRELDLGPKLSTVTVLNRSKYTGPKVVDFELSEGEAKRRRAADPNSVGRWEDDNGNKGFYDVAKYQKAKSEYLTWRKLAHDDLALTLRMKVDAVQKVRLLESRGYEIVIED